MRSRCSTRQPVMALVATALIILVFHGFGGRHAVQPANKEPLPMPLTVEGLYPEMIRDMAPLRLGNPAKENDDRRVTWRVDDVRTVSAELDIHGSRIDAIIGERLEVDGVTVAEAGNGQEHARARLQAVVEDFQPRMVWLHQTQFLVVEGVISKLRLEEGESSMTLRYERSPGRGNHVTGHSFVLVFDADGRLDRVLAAWSGN